MVSGLHFILNNLFSSKIEQNDRYFERFGGSLNRLLPLYSVVLNSLITLNVKSVLMLFYIVLGTYFYYKILEVLT